MDDMGCQMRNYIDFMVGVSGIPLGYVEIFDIPVVWMAVKDHDCLKYQAIYIGRLGKPIKWTSTPI